MVCSSLERASALLVRHTDLCFAHANCDAAGEAALIEACAQEEPEPLALHRLQTAYGLFRTLYRKLAAVPTPTYDWKQHQAVDDRLGPWAQRSKRTVRGTGRRASAHACGWFAPAADCVFIAGDSYTAYTARAQRMHVTSMLPGPRRKWCPAHGPPSALPGRSRRRRRARLPRRSGAGRGRSATWWCRSMPKASWHRLRPAGSPEAAFSARARLRLPRAPASLGPTSRLGRAGTQALSALRVDTQVVRCTERVLARLPLLLARLHGCVGTVYVHEVCRAPRRPQQSEYI